MGSPKIFCLCRDLNSGFPLFWFHYWLVSNTLECCLESLLRSCEKAMDQKATNVITIEKVISSDAFSFFLFIFSQKRQTMSFCPSLLVVFSAKLFTYNLYLSFYKSDGQRHYYYKKRKKYFTNGRYLSFL